MGLVAVRSLKRKTSSNQKSRNKKLCIVPVDPTEGSFQLEGIGVVRLTSTAELQHPDISSFNDSSSDSESESICDTPLTQISSTASPRFPSELKTHLCTYNDCGKAFNRPAKLAQHLLSHTNTRSFVCPHEPCTKDFLRQSHLSHHIKSAHTDVRDYVCEWSGCTKSFITATRLKRHHAAHEGRTKFQCTVTGCSQTFRKHGTLQKHIVTVHEGRKPFSCEFRDQNGIACGQGFETAGKLRTHEGRVHGGQRFWCSICSTDISNNNSAIPHQLEEDTAGFSTYAELQIHIKAIHPPECSTCGLVCSSQRELKSHVEIRHGTASVDDRKTFICPEPDCSRAFTKKGNLNVHIQSAHKAKKYICGEVRLELLNNVEGWDGLNACGRALSTKGSLQNHIRTVHMDMGRRRSRPAKKSMGGPSASHDGATSNLIKLTGAGYDKISSRHILCPMSECGYRFGRHYDLRVHLLSHHAVQEDDVDRFTASARHGLNSTYSMQDFNAQDWSPMDTQGYEDDDDEGLINAGRFWIGDDSYDNESQDDDEWFQDENTMRLLIDDDRSGVQGQDTLAIDPIFR
ncbi:MAG: hypothetical protein Q9209_007016 [Squamulea sp. 1 TL-2023]